MDFYFQDDGADIIRRELLSPRSVIIQSLGMQESVALNSTSKTYIKLVQNCRPGEDCVISYGTQTSSWGTNWQYRVGDQSPQQIDFNLGEDQLQGFDSEGPAKEKTCSAEQDEEAEIDALAQEIAEIIRNLHNEDTNPGNAEFGALILRLVDDNGDVSFRRTDIGRSGQSAAIGLADLYALAQRSFPGIDGSNVVRVVHLHPAGLPTDPPVFRDVQSIGQLDDRDFGNTMPSHPRNLMGAENDWDNTVNFLSDRGLVNTNNLSHSILGPDGVLREFDYADGHPAEQSQQVDLINQAEADAEGECT